MSAMPEASRAGFLATIDGLVCDLDGVVYRASDPIPRAIACLQELGRRGFPVVYCTNNSALTPEAYVEKLKGMGLSTQPQDVITSSIVAGEILSELGLNGKTAYVVGAEGLQSAVADAGLEILPRDSSDADVVVVGSDRSFDYEMLDNAARAVRRGAFFIAANDDATYPSEKDIEPGAGALLAAIEVAGGRRAEVAGKPHEPMMKSAARRFPSGARLAMAGDRPNTDLDGARAMGWTTILVLSGVTDEEAALALDPQPDLTLEDLGGLLDAPVDQPRH